MISPLRAVYAVGRGRLRRAYLEASIIGSGSFPYFGHKVFAVRDSEIFQRIATVGVFEPDILEVLQCLARPQTTVFDVGANIGVVTVAMLAKRSDLQFIAIECSPSTLPFLRRTYAASNQRDRWQVVEAAMTDQDGVVEFFTAGEAMGAFDGIKDTGRGGPARLVRPVGSG